jgi:hypothetical protein
MALVPAMHNLVVADIIPMPMPMVFIAVVFVAVAVTLSIFIVIFVFGAMFIVTAPVSMTFMLGKSHAGA